MCTAKSQHQLNETREFMEVPILDPLLGDVLMLLLAFSFVYRRAFCSFVSRLFSFVQANS